MTYLRLRKVAKSYDGKTNAVDDVSIEIERGEFVTFLGPSGSGKTTTLLMIAGFETPTGGMIELGGHDLTLSRPYERNIGMVFQNYALFPHMTAAKNVLFPLKMRHFPKRDMQARAERMLALVGLSPFAERYPRELSGGQQQRVALARGLVFNPDVLLLDEPLGALDKNLREQMQVEIKRIHREIGITMIYVTHDQTEAMTMSDRVAVFSNGKVEQIGSPLEVYNRPVNRFVGEFIGDSNFFAGRVDPSRPGWVELAGIGPVRIATQATAPAGECTAEDPLTVSGAVVVRGVEEVDPAVERMVDRADRFVVVDLAPAHRRLLAVRSAQERPADRPAAEADRKDLDAAPAQPAHPCYDASTHRSLVSAGSWPSSAH